MADMREEIARILYNTMSKANTSRGGDDYGVTDWDSLTSRDWAREEFRKGAAAALDYIREQLK